MGHLATNSVQRPSLALLGAEPFRAALEFARHMFAKSEATMPGDGHPVVIFPGLGADGTSVATLRDHCRLLGYDVGWLYRLLSGSSAALDPALARRLRIPPPLRTTSIYSRSDGVVAWQTCRHGKRSSLVHDIEVGGSHIGMGWNRDVLAVVADRLGQPRGTWRRYVGAQ